ncbi:hypothetical protein D3C75_771950 [compost metagenome]
MVVRPRPACSRRAAAIGAGEWPNMLPVSPRQKSTYSRPSTSTKRAPSARSTNSGTGVDQSLIQCIGTPPNSAWRARPASATDCGCCSRKRWRSRAARACTAVSAIPLEFMLEHLVEFFTHLRAAQRAKSIQAPDQPTPPNKPPVQPRRGDARRSVKSASAGRCRDDLEPTGRQAFSIL